MDYGHRLEFGTFLTPDAGHAERVVQLAQLTEDVGLDLVTIQDHPYQAKFLDTWTLLSVIGAKTTRVRLSPNVANLPPRPPAVLARSVASLDLLTDGRVELGLGAGGFVDAIASIGGPRLTPGAAVDALAEGIGIIRAMWDTAAATVRIEGEHYRVWGAHPGPAPAHDVGVWLGAYKPRMLALTGRAADGWLPSSPYAKPEQLAAMNRRIDEAAANAGREPAGIRRLYNITGSFSAGGTGFLQGPAAMWAQQLADIALSDGMSVFILMADQPDDIRRFAAEVAPAVIELVATERDAGGRTEPDTSTSEPTTAPATPPAARTTAPPAERPRIRSAGTLGGSPLAAVPTPPPTARLSNTQPWDDATRPTGPTPDPNRPYTPHEQASGRHLIDVHDHLRAELSQLRGVVSEVLSGAMEPGLARSHINTMTMRQNNWTVGAYCAQYCRTVTTHHSLEDASVFPHLRRADRALAPVISRLEEEHRTIHDVLEGVDHALVAFVSLADGPRQLQAALDLLTDALLSHLSYEERELVEPLARLGFY